MHPSVATDPTCYCTLNLMLDVEMPGTWVAQYPSLRPRSLLMPLDTVLSPVSSSVISVQR